MVRLSTWKVSLLSMEFSRCCTITPLFVAPLQPVSRQYSGGYPAPPGYHSAQRQSRAVQHLAHHETGMHPADAFNTGKRTQQKLLIMLHITHNHLQHIVGALAGDQVAFQHFWAGADPRLKVIKALGG